MIKVKICGNRSIEDVATSQQADGLGFIVATPQSPRNIDIETAQELLRKIEGKVKFVVTTEPNPNKVIEIVSRLKPDILQVHSELSLPQWGAIRYVLDKEIRLFGLLSIREEGSEQELINKAKPISKILDGIILDTSIDGRKGGTGKAHNWNKSRAIRDAIYPFPVALAGGLNPDNVHQAIRKVRPTWVDVCSGVEQDDVKDPKKVKAFLQHARIILNSQPEHGKFGSYGGAFVPEIIIPALHELEKAYLQARNDECFEDERRRYNRDYGGRPSPLYFAQNLTRYAGGAKIYLKREDLIHGGAHKFNNVIGQALLAKKMGKRRIIAETGAGQHGTATALAGAVLGIKTEVYMGAVDAQRQRMNLFRMRLLGAEVHIVQSGSKTLKDAINEALRDWATNVRDSYYLLGSVVGPHPYPMIVRDFQSVIGNELKRQIIRRKGRLPDLLIACVGGGSNALGTFYPFVEDDVAFLGVEAGGNEEKHGASLGKGRPGVLHGAKTYLLQDNWGQIAETYSIAAGLDYPGVGPEHVLYKELGRAQYISASDRDALKGFQLLSELEGIIPALEPAHAIYVAVQHAQKMGPDQIVVVTLSGRGDKDLETVIDVLGADYGAIEDNRPF